MFRSSRHMLDIKTLKWPLFESCHCLHKMNSAILLSSVFLALHWNPALPASIRTCLDTPDVENSSHEAFEVNVVPRRVHVRYVCNDGYYMEGSPEITCSESEEGHRWQPQPPTCHELKRCKEIWRIKNGLITGEEDCCPPGYKFGFGCHDGYQLDGPAELTCLNNGSWDHAPPTCLRQSCEYLSDLPYGFTEYWKDDDFYYGDDIEHGVVAHFICDKKHDLIGPANITCQNREWTSTRPRCKPQGVAVCEDIAVPHSDLTQEKSHGDYFVEDDIVLVSCKHGYRISGSDFLECTSDGTWSDPVPSCVEFNCTRGQFRPDPHMIVEEFVNTNITEFPVDSRIYLKCEKGYMLEGASSLTCASGGWSGKAKCRKIHCGRPSVPEYGSMTVDTTSIGGVASFGCRQGYKLLGSQNRFCLDNGVWSGTVARCVAEVGLMSYRGCESPGIPDNGVKMGTYYGYGAKVTFSCNPGYRLRGEDTIVCGPKGTWSDPIPSCLGPFYYDVPWNVKESLDDTFTELTNTSDALNQDADGIGERALNLNISGVRHVVYFVIDASSSMGDRDFQKGIQLTTAIIKKINVTERGHRVGVVIFSNDTSLIVQPHVHTTMDAVLPMLRNISYTGGGTALTKALQKVQVDFDTARGIFDKSTELHLSIFLITDGKANLGGSPKQIMTTLQRRNYGAKVYGIGVTTSPDRDALMDLVSQPVEDYLFILRDYDSYIWLAETLTNGTIDYSVCGSTHRHNIDTGKEDVVQARIAGGEKVETPWTWMAEVTQENQKGLCGGSIISRTWILTAAHCVCSKGTNSTLSPDKITVRLGLTDRQDKAFVEEATVKSIVQHPDYSAKTLENDIALIELESNLTYGPYIRRVCLPPENPGEDSTFYREGKPAFVIGWGKNGTRKSVDMLQQVKATIVSNGNCSQAYELVKGSVITDNMMCAGGYGAGDACQGDSGGPLMQGTAKDEYIWTQVGIVSFGHGQTCNKKDKPGVYTNVAKYRRWIDQYVTDSQEARN